MGYWLVIFSSIDFLTSVSVEKLRVEKDDIQAELDNEIDQVALWKQGSWYFLRLFIQNKKLRTLNFKGGSGAANEGFYNKKSTACLRARKNESRKWKASKTKRLGPAREGNFLKWFSSLVQIFRTNCVKMLPSSRMNSHLAVVESSFSLQNPSCRKIFQQCTKNFPEMKNIWKVEIDSS